LKPIVAFYSSLFLRNFSLKLDYLALIISPTINEVKALKICGFL